MTNNEHVYKVLAENFIAFTKNIIMLKEAHGDNIFNSKLFLETIQKPISKKMLNEINHMELTKDGTYGHGQKGDEPSQRIPLEYAKYHQAFDAGRAEMSSEKKKNKPIPVDIDKLGTTISSNYFNNIDNSKEYDEWLRKFLAGIKSNSLSNIIKLSFDNDNKQKDIDVIAVDPKGDQNNDRIRRNNLLLTTTVKIMNNLFLWWIFDSTNPNTNNSENLDKLKNALPREFKEIVQTVQRYVKDGLKQKYVDIVKATTDNDNGYATLETTPNLVKGYRENNISPIHTFVSRLTESKHITQSKNKYFREVYSDVRKIKSYL